MTRSKLQCIPMKKHSEIISSNSLRIFYINIFYWILKTKLKSNIFLVLSTYISYLILPISPYFALVVSSASNTGLCFYFTGYCSSMETFSLNFATINLLKNNSSFLTIQFYCILKHYTLNSYSAIFLYCTSYLIAADENCTDSWVWNWIEKLP